MSEIVGVRALRVWDSRGRPTVEVEVLLDDGTSERGIAPSGKSRGSHEALELRDGTAGLGGFDVQNALREIEREIRPLLIGWDSLDQVGIDRALIALDGTPNKSRLGGNALVATSMAVLNAAATSARQSLWRYIAGEKKVQLPLPQIQIFGGGAHAASQIDIQDLMVIAVSAGSYPIASIEDPFAEDDDGWVAFSRAAGSRVQIVGDDYLVTDAARITGAAQRSACNAVLIKPNQVGTVTETRDALSTAKKAGMSTIVSARSGDTEDTTIVHLAAGLNAGQLKVGSFSRSERMCKWNEGIRIETTSGINVSFAGRNVLAGSRQRI